MSWFSRNVTNVPAPWSPRMAKIFIVLSLFTLALGFSAIFLYDGHPGGVGTIHANTAIGALRRLEQLVQEAVLTVPRALIAETIDIVAVLSGRGAERRLAEIAHVNGLDPATGDYRTLNALLPSPQPSKGDPE